MTTDRPVGPPDLAHPSRRALLHRSVSAIAVAGLPAACRRAPPPPVTGTLLGTHRMPRGHGVVGKSHPSATPPAGRVPVVIVGGGVAGLAAAWRLTHSGVPVRLVDLDTTLGGTAQFGTSTTPATQGQPFALGAHYLTLPNRDNHPTRRLLRALGILTHTDADDRDHFAPGHLCLAPQERLYVAGEWIRGLWPTPIASPEDTAQRDAFEHIVDTWSHRIGADGRPAFTIPTALSSRDPEIRALADVSFADWLDQQGFTSAPLRWLLEYGTRDDYGTSLTHTSAWAGLHYHCARRPTPADDRDLGTQVLTWPEGNGRLVTGLAELAAPHLTTHLGTLVHHIEADTGRVHATRADGSGLQIDADHVILAVPAPVARHLLKAAPDATLPTAAPWRVAVLHCDAPPASRGVPLAWDSVVYGATDLGTISNAHQLGRYGGPTVLTYYEPLVTDPTAARRALASATWEDGRDRVLAALSPVHADLRERLHRLDVWHWGHGTVRPVPGLHSGPALARLAEPTGRVHRAHTDLSGLSLFEEALWHGVRAAEEVLAPTESWLG